MCGAEFQIDNGTTFFSSTGRSDTSRSGCAPNEVSHDPMRLAALMNLDSHGKSALLVGFDESLARSLNELTAAKVVVVVQASSATEVQCDSDVVISRIVCDLNAKLPFAEASFNGVAFDCDNIPESVVPLLKPKARLVASVSATQYEGVTEIARDDTQWVAERDITPTQPISLTRQLSH